MKRLLLFVCAAAMSVSCSEANKPVTYDQLPRKAQEFIETNLNSNRVSYILMDKEMFDKSYDVAFSDGTSVEFDKKGEWKEVKNRMSSVPLNIVPRAIRDYITLNHQDMAITEIGRSKGRYEIKLGNGLEIKFNKNFQVVEYDD